MKIVIFLLGIFLACNADAATYWVNSSASGQHCVNSGTNPGSGSSSKTITQGLACVGSAGTDAGAGNTVMVVSGTYNEQLIDKIPNGAAGNVFTLKAVTNRGAVLCPNVGNPIIELNNTVHYIVIDGLQLDGSCYAGSDAPQDGLATSSGDVTTLHDLSFINMEIHSVPDNGFSVQGFNITISGNYVHDTGTERFAGGTGFAHSCYCRLNNSTITANQFVNAQGYGLHENTGGGDAINNNTISANVFSGNGFPGNQWGVLLAGRNQRFFNNIIYGNSAAIIVGHGANVADTNYIYENTIYNNSAGGYGAIVLQFQANTFIQSNIIRSSNAPWDTSFETPTSFVNNMCDSSPTGCTNADPLFVNAGANNFYLQAGSPAINVGPTLGAPYNVDYAGTARPQGIAYDLGAYEYISGAPSAPTGMVAFNGGPGVAVSSCGTGASVSGNDSSGKVNVGTGTVTSCSVNFSGTYGKAPNCIAAINIATVALSVSATESGFTLSTGASNIAGDSFNYLCVQTGKQ